jgi:hypothetical protein
LPPFLLLEREWVEAAALAMGQHWAGVVLLALHWGAAVLLLPRCSAVPPPVGGDGGCRPLLFFHNFSVLLHFLLEKFQGVVYEFL